MHAAAVIFASALGTILLGLSFAVSGWTGAAITAAIYIVASLLCVFLIALEAFLIAEGIGETEQ